MSALGGKRTFAPMDFLAPRIETELTFVSFSRMVEEGLQGSKVTKETEPELSSQAVEFAVRLIERLVTIGVLSREDAIAVYRNTLESIYDVDTNAAALRIAEAITRHSDPN